MFFVHMYDLYYNGVDYFMYTRIYTYVVCFVYFVVSSIFEIFFSNIELPLPQCSNFYVSLGSLLGATLK